MIETAQEFEDFLKQTLESIIMEADAEAEEAEEESEEEITEVICTNPFQDTDIEYQELQGASVKTYSEGMYLTRDNGMVVTFPDGREFQITIVRR